MANKELIDKLLSEGIFNKIDGKVTLAEDKINSLIDEANTNSANEGAEGLCYSVVLEKPFKPVEGKENLFKVSEIIAESAGASNSYVVSLPYEHELGYFQEEFGKVIGDNKIVSCKLIY